MTIEERLTALAAAPKTHAVISEYADGTQKVHETRNRASADTHLTFVVGPKVGRSLICRETGKTVTIVKAWVEAL